ALVQQATAIIKRLLKPDGCNIGLNIGSVAGAGIDDHLHVHIVPRWQDDHNFIAVLAEIKAIPQHITATFELLLPEFKALYRSLQPAFKTSP
ncbi:MAG: HIT family hydrolase, partial [Desulfocapsaceae bacterium]